MSKEKIVVDFYVLCYKLKNTIRTGWKDWNVKRDRLESVAEHIYGAQMIALGMYSEYDYEINIWKVILMLAIHELEETIIGDLTQFQISREEKEKWDMQLFTEFCRICLWVQRLKESLWNLMRGKRLKPCLHTSVIRLNATL